MSPCASARVTAIRRTAAPRGEATEPGNERCYLSGALGFASDDWRCGGSARASRIRLWIVGTGVNSHSAISFAGTPRTKYPKNTR